MSEKKNTICTIPWNHQATYQNGDYGICCQCIYTSGGRMLTDGKAVSSLTDDFNEVRNHPTIVELRRSMLNGEKNDLCKLCWDEEDLGLVSKRQQQQHAYKDTLNKILEQTDTSGKIDTNEFPIEYLDSRLGNLCNLVCRMCGPGDSSLWIEETYERGTTQFKFGKINTPYEIEKVANTYKIKGDDFQYYDTPKFNDDIKQILPSLNRIYFTGGEPLINKKHYEILDYCIENDFAKNITLEYNTNGTTLNKNLLNQWKHFQSVIVCFSIDGMDDMANYIRYPSKWEVIKQHMYELDNADIPQLYCTTNVTVNIFNIKHFIEMLEWYHNTANFKRFHHKLMWHRLVGPDWLNVQILPQTTKKEITALYDEYVAKSTVPFIKEHIYSIIDYMNEKDSSQLLPRAIEIIKWTDNYRNQDLADTIPWLAEALNYTRK
jgi:organic radical activating enzyme